MIVFNILESFLVATTGNDNHNVSEGNGTTESSGGLQVDMNHMGQAQTSIPWFLSVG